MSDELSQRILAALNRMPDWLRRDLSSKDDAEPLACRGGALGDDYQRAQRARGQLNLMRDVSYRVAEPAHFSAGSGWKAGVSDPNETRPIDITESPIIYLKQGPVTVHFDRIFVTSN